MPPASFSVLPGSRAVPGFQLASSSPPLRPAAYGDGSIARGCLCPLRSALWDGVCMRGGCGERAGGWVGRTSCIDETPAAISGSREVSSFLCK